MGMNRRCLTQEYADGMRPAVLVSYAYRRMYEPMRKAARVRHWVLDSGAFTAHASGKPIDLQEFIDYSLKMLEEDKLLKHVFGLDVIGNHEASMRNVEEMVRQGIEAIPTVHSSAPTEAMQECRKYPRVALGGMVGMHRKAQQQFIEQAFSVLWPKWLHAFGMTNEKLLMRFPFASCDATSWESAPMRFGRYRSQGLQILPIRGGDRQLGSEVEWHLRLERRLQQFWADALKQTETT